MEGLIQLIAVLVIMFFLGAQNMSKKMREQQKDSQDDLPPIFPPRTQKPSPETKSRESKPSYTRETPEPPRPKSEPFPTPASNEPIWSKMLREMLELDEPKPEPIPETPPQPVRTTKKLIRKSKDSDRKPPALKTKPVKLPKRADEAQQKKVGKRLLPTPLASIYQRAENEPLRGAILLSEIIQPPRAKRKQIRTL